MSGPALYRFAQGQGSVSASNLNGVEQTCDTYNQLRQLVGETGMQVFCRGKYAPNDGGTAIFYWDATSTAADDNSTVLDPVGGASTGRWIQLNFQAFGLFDRREIIYWILTTPLDAGEQFGVISPPLGETWTFPANLYTSSGLQITGGTSPGADYIIDIVRNGGSVGTITLATDGSVTYSTAGFSLIGGTDAAVLTGNATPDSAVGYVFTFRGVWAPS